MNPWQVRLCTAPARGNPEKNKSRRLPSPSQSEGDAERSERRGCAGRSHPHSPTCTAIPATPRHSREPPSFPRTREPREKQITPFTVPFAKRRGRGAQRTQGMPAKQPSFPAKHPSFPARTPSFPQEPRHSREAAVIPADAGIQRKTKHAIPVPFAQQNRSGRGRFQTCPQKREEHPVKSTLQGSDPWQPQQ